MQLLAHLLSLPPAFFGTPALITPGWVTPTPPGEPTAVVLHGDRIVVGTTRGLYARSRKDGDGDGPWSLVLAEDVRDVAAQSEALLVAARGGLYEWRADAEPRRVPLAAGARPSSLAIAADGSAFVATEAGLFVRSRGESDFHRDTVLPAGDVGSVHVVAHEVWASAAGTLWRRANGGRFEPEIRGGEEGWWELRAAVALGGSTLLCVPGGLWRLGAHGPERVRLGLGELRDAAVASGALWLASERGVFALRPDAVANGSGHPRARWAEPGATDVEVTPVGVLAAGARGVALLAAGDPAPGAVTGFSTPPQRDEGPAVLEVQRSVLGYLELEPSRLRRLEERSHRVGLLPEVRATFGVDRSIARTREHDQSVVSGLRHQLLDSDIDRDRELSLAVQLVWDLEQLASPDDAIAVSRERRELIELRDQVLERVNRLYFDRLRVRAELDASSDPDARALLRLRARELEAALDAWSGGRFSSPSGTRPLH